jgi:hypothetical protein
MNKLETINKTETINNTKPPDKEENNDNEKNIEKALTYAKSLIGIPYRWYDESTELVAPNDKFYYAAESTLSRDEIITADKSIVCAGLINLMRRKLSLSIPKYGAYPGGTVAWYKYLKSNNRLQKLSSTDEDIHDFPIGTLLLKKYQNEVEQGHLAVIIDSKLIIHAYAYTDIPYALRHKYKNHGCVGISACDLSYFTHSCLPENWLIVD